MKNRCNNTKIKCYPNYGGRGISYDTKWETFDGFYEDMHETYSDNLTIDRIDVNGNYYKDNIQWITKSENSKKAHTTDAKRKKEAKD